VFSWSVQLLPEAPAVAFGLLGAHPAQDLALPAVAALLDTSAALAGDWLDVLRRAHLVTVDGDRFGMHDLLRTYARDLTPPSQRNQAVARLTDFYLHTASTAMDLLYPSEQDWRPKVAAGSGLEITDVFAAREWLSAEVHALVALAGHAADLTVAAGGPDAAGLLSKMVWRFLFVGGYAAEAVTLYGHARRSARAVGDQVAEAAAVSQLGATHYASGDNLRARQLVEEALELARLAGDREREGSYLQNLGLMCWMLGEPQRALEHEQESLAIHREVGNRTGEGHALGTIGLLHYVAGRHADAIATYQQALAINREIGDTYGEFLILDSLGAAFLRLGLAHEALDHYDASLAICRELGSRPGEASCWRAKSVALVHLGRYDEALDLLHQALDVFAATGHREHGRALNDLANLSRIRGSLAAARLHHEEALGLARSSNDRYLEVEVLNDLALTLLAAGLRSPAEERLAAARALATEIGARYELARANRISS
jgi:tetratricopeptide (TPR) repeat protein